MKIFLRMPLARRPGRQHREAFKKNAALTAASVQGTKNRLLMRTNLCLATLVAFCVATSVRAQNPPPARPGDSKITLDKMAAVSSNPLGVDTNVVSLLSFDSELPLKTAIETLANQASLQFRYAPELMPDGKSAAVLNARVGTARFEQMTAFEALQRLLRKNDLVLGKMAGSPDVLIGTKESKLTPAAPR